jgi:hypothetical protein
VSSNIVNLEQFHNFRRYLGDKTMKLPLSNNVRIVAFPPHTSGIFQMLDLVFFGVFERAKRWIQRNLAVPFIQDHTMRMFRAHETAVACLTVRGSFHRVGFLYRKNENRSYLLEFDKGHVRGSPQFCEVWDISFPLQSLTPRFQHSRWQLLDGFAIAS